MKKSELAQLFLTGLSVAGAACAAAEDPPPTPRAPLAPEPVEILPFRLTQPVSASVLAYAREFVTVDSMREALPSGAELVAFIDYSSESNGYECTPAPCEKAWLPSVEDKANGALVRVAGRQELITYQNFRSFIGKVDTPAKALLRLRIDSAYTFARCSQFEDVGLPCAEGNSQDGALVRKSEHGFEVAIFGRLVCRGSDTWSRALAPELKTVTIEGDLTYYDDILTMAFQSQAKQVPGLCPPPMRMGRMYEGYRDLAGAETELAYCLKAHREESAAVFAFEHLAVELEKHGAPAALVLAARRSAGEERRHAAAFRTAAEQHSEARGQAVSIEPLAAPPLGDRPLEAMLIENAVEGCANETYAAIVATHQATHAPPRIRKIFERIAPDEQLHAALAHRIHAWGISILPADARARVVVARARAVENMRAPRTLSALAQSMGEPPPDVAQAAFDHVCAVLAA